MSFQFLSYVREIHRQQVDPALQFGRFDHLVPGETTIPGHFHVLEVEIGQMEKHHIQEQKPQGSVYRGCPD
jgi:hypothetical protein